MVLLPREEVAEWSLEGAGCQWKSVFHYWAVVFSHVQDCFLTVCMCVCMCVYQHVHFHMYIYIEYRVIEAHRMTTLHAGLASR